MPGREEKILNLKQNSDNASCQSSKCSLSHNPTGTYFHPSAATSHICPELVSGTCPKLISEPPNVPGLSTNHKHTKFPNNTTYLPIQKPAKPPSLIFHIFLHPALLSPIIFICLSGEENRM